MIDYVEVLIRHESDYQIIRNHLPDSLVDDDVINLLSYKVGLTCDAVIIEYPYYDRDYLSTYYTHYSQKFRRYEKQCARLHFEKGDEYLGFITLRPTLGDTKFGKSYVSPKLLLHSKAYLMLGEHTAHVYGQDMRFKAFPWKRQQTDISCCAHTAVWTIIRYFSNRYHGYQDATIGDIAGRVQNERGRKTPTQGLTPTQVSDLFKEYGFSPLIIENSIDGRDDSYSEFVEEIFTYIESGLPMVGFIAPEKHAVTIMGHGSVDYKRLEDEEFVDTHSESELRVISHTRLINSIYVMDDGAFPYCEVPVGLPNSKSDVRYGLNQFSFAVVPLYPKMHLTYHEVYHRMIQWLKLKVMSWEECSVFRIYLTSSNSLKRHTKASKTMNEKLKNIILRLSFPKFVWCIDLSGVENFRRGLTSGRIILDATSATLEKEPWIIRHDMRTIQFRDYDEDLDNKYILDVDIEPYDIYINNLEECN